MIPRITHQMWIGGEMPGEYQRYRRRWVELHPTWQHRFWTEHTIGRDLMPLRNQDLWDRAPEIAPKAVEQFRSDVVRYEILDIYGGVWIDADFEPLKPIDEFLENEAFLSWEEDQVWATNCIFGAVPDHPFLDQLIEGLPERVASYPGASNTVISGPQFLTPIAVYREDVTFLPSRYFLPYSWRELGRKGEEFPDAFAVHHWHNRRRRAEQ